MFRAIDNPVPTIADRATFHPAHVRAGFGFRHREGIHFFAAHCRKQVAFALITFAGHQNILGAPKEMRQRHRPTAQLTFDKGEVQMRQASTTDLFREVARVKAEINDLLLQILGQFIVNLTALFDFVFKGVDFIFNKAADRIYDHRLLFT